MERNLKNSHHYVFSPENHRIRPGLRATNRSSPPQTVTYTADHENGYRANVDYSGGGGVAALPARPVVGAR